MARTTGRQLIALDGDGVLLDYNLAYAQVWQRAFGLYPQERDPNAYWAMDRWQVERLGEETLQLFRAHFDEAFWESVPATEGAVQACRALHAAGFDLICITALPQRFAAARQRNLQRLGFPIDKVVATDSQANGRSPKADALLALRPAAFVDDYLPYLAGIDAGIHTALILRGTNGSPNTGDAMRHVSSIHQSLMDFSTWWLQQPSSRAV